MTVLKLLRAAATDGVADSWTRWRICETCTGFCQDICVMETLACWRSECKCNSACSVGCGAALHWWTQNDSHELSLGCWRTGAAKNRLAEWTLHCLHGYRRYGPGSHLSPRHRSRRKRL